jgi:vacuolar protein-sorting-associated protein 4
VSLADITSKFMGESEKLLAMLFQLARDNSPAIILIDEMDSLGRKRTGKESETDRRTKTEFLRQMDLIKQCSERVSVFATTNMPWELDIAALRRFERKVLVPVPNKQHRAQILKLHVGTHHILKEDDF